MGQSPQIGQDVTHLMGGPAAPPVGADVSHLMGETPLPVFRSSAIATAADQQLARTDLPADVRAELERIRDDKAGSGDNWLTALTPSGAYHILHGLMAPVRAWGDAGPHRVHEGLNEIGNGQFSKGAHDVIVGGGVTALPMIAPAFGRALMAAPATTIATTTGVTATSAAGGAVAHGVAKAVGASDDQATLAGDVASLGAGTAVAKYGVPALATWSANRNALAMGRDYIQSTRDVQAALGVNAADVHRARPFLEAVHNDPNGTPIVGTQADGGAMDQLVKAADVAVEEIERHIASVVQQFPEARVPASASAIYGRVAQMPGAKASDIAAARTVIADYGLDQPRSLQDAESLRIRLNAENKAILEGSGVKQRTAVLTNPAYVAKQEAANQLRDGIYGALEQRGVQGIRNLRLSEGSILKLRNAADPVMRGLRSESTVARTGETSLPRRVAQHVVRAGSAGAGALLGGPIGAGVGAEVGQDLASGLTTKNLSKNALLERAFGQSFTSPPVMSVQRMPPPTTGAPTSPGGPPRLPGVGLPGGPSRALPPAPPAPPSALGPGATPLGPVPVESGGGGVGAKSIVVRDPRTGRMRRIYVSDAK